MMAIPVEAISRLNAHARGHGGVWGKGVARAIYAYKELAALMAATDGTASLRFVKWQGKCALCTNGRFQHWEWTDGYTVRCRDCRGTGIRTLRFTETRFAGGQVWHHPWEGRSTPGRSLADAVLGLTWVDDGQAGFHITYAGQDIDWRPVTSWQPQQPPQELPLAELVPLLNTVEDWVESAESIPASGSPWVRERAQRHLHAPHRRGYWSEGDPPEPSYTLDLGRIPGGCFVCGAEPSTHYGRMSDQFHWSLPVCWQHGQGPERVPFPKDPPPADLITPDLQRWLNRHSRHGARP